MNEKEYITINDLENFKHDLKRDLIKSLKFQFIDKLPIKKGYSIFEFSEFTGLEVSTITNYCKTGKLKASQIVKGGSWLILTSELDRLIAEAISNHINQVVNPNRRDHVILEKLRQQGVDLEITEVKALNS